MNGVHDVEDGSPEQLARVDLNLVVAFDALVRERNVTRAAQRVGVTQSAMSHSLRRLRGLLGDPLLVRGRGGMVLTPRAESLVVPLRSGLVTVGRALAQPTRFEPASARRSFRLVSPDLFDVLVIPSLLERIRDEAPGIDLAVAPADGRRIADRLETGEVDAAIVPEVDDVGGEDPEMTASGLLRRRLFRDRFVCLLRADHPALTRPRRGCAQSTRRRLTLESYAGLSHALVSPSGEGIGFVDELLERQGLKRRIALRIPHFYAALAIVAKSDLVLTAPTPLARLAPPASPVVVLPAPLPLPQHSVYLVWHERFSKERGHGWLRKVIAEVSQSVHLDGEPPSRGRGRRA